MKLSIIIDVDIQGDEAELQVRAPEGMDTEEVVYYMGLAMETMYDTKPHLKLIK